MVALPQALHPGLVRTLRVLQIESLYTHQAAAWRCVEAGGNPVIVTGTASGKTLCYNLPVLDRALRDPRACSLYLFPTKALAQDQQSTLRQLIAALPEPNDVSVGTYDGDTPAHARPGIRRNARILITNPDMLHTGILPHHATWADFFRHLQFVVVDEMHTYRGVFGSHVANVVRRLSRVAAFHGASPQFILTSATIANPLELAQRLIERPVCIIDDDGSARGVKHFLIYNPPIVDPDLGLRQSVLTETVRLANDLVRYGVQTLVFARSRRAVELILNYLRQSQDAAADTIRGYRSGYLPHERRSIERELRHGTVQAVIATNALELGIDIGGMEATVLAGYPGTIAATWQQAGRSGRGDAPSLTVLLTSADPLDQFLAHHPDYFFGRSPEQGLTDPDNLLILLEHLQCAAYELPFTAGQEFGDVSSQRVQEILDYLSAQNILHSSGGRYFWMADRYPSGSVSLRSASPSRIVLDAGAPDRPCTVGEVDLDSACWMVHPGAVYMHEGRTYLVTDLDLEGRIARMREVNVGYYTEPRCETTVSLIGVRAQADVPGARAAYGEIAVTSQVIGFRKVRWHTHEQLGIENLDLEPTQLQTVGYWIAPTEKTVAHLREKGLWRNDPNDYGPNWSTQRDRARARDGYRCVSCGVPEEGHAHHVHHKVPFRTFSSYLEANRIANLVTLCPRCHRRVEVAVRMRSGLSGLSFVLRHLAPLFVMCDAHDLGVHSDPRSPLAADQPAVVVYDQVPAGIGFSERLFGLHTELMNRALEWVLACGCVDGCPSCVGPAGEEGQGGKRETLALLEALT